VRDDPPLVAARREFLSWLAEVPETHQTSWKQRLKSNLDDHPHLSVRLELYLHHYFKSHNWDIEIEPEMPTSPNKPDFAVIRGADRILVEAKAVFDKQSTTQQTQRLRQLADNLTSKLSRNVIIEPQSDLPPSLPARRIRLQIEERAKKADEILEFDLSNVHQNRPYSLKIIILPRASDSTELEGVGGTISGVQTLTTGKRVRDALEQKAGKYGDMNMPFLIAIYGTGEFPVRTKDELDALFGDRIWNLTVSGQATERRKPNGFFASMREGKRRHEGVSAVLFYRFKWINDTHVHSAHIYHNPFALRALSPDLFLGMPQMISALKWINGEPD